LTVGAGPREKPALHRTSPGLNQPCCFQNQEFPARNYITPVSYEWDLNDDDGDFEDGTGQTIHRFEHGTRRYLAGVRATDAGGQTVVTRKYLTFERKSGPEPETVPAVDVLGMSFRNAAGAEYVPDQSRKTKGLIIIAHGLCSSASEPWLAQMAQAIETRLGAGSTPNICLYDWSTMANPSYFQGLSDLPCESKLEILNNLKFINPYALTHGRILADRIKSEIDSGNIDSTMPIHIIGHSAGGFVAGECATLLKKRGIVNVSQVTMLDTPIPERKHVADYREPGRVDRYISSCAGRFAPDLDGVGCKEAAERLTDCEGYPSFAKKAAKLWGCITALPRNLFYHRSDIPNSPMGLVEAHNYSHDWYTRNTIMGVEHDGFWHSPWLGNSFPAGTASGAAGFQPASDGLQIQAVTNFQAFGTVTSSNDTYIVTEEVNAGIFTDLAMPIGAQSLRFRYHFATAGDGDFLSVHWGTNELLYIGVDGPISREGFVDGDVAVNGLAGQTNQLVFKLVSRGTTNAVLVLSQVEMAISDDPDGDGVATTEELTVGTNPLLYDTDGDGLNDGDELMIYHTNPLASDSDGDGISDGEELLTETDPNNQLSVLRIASIRFDAPSIVTIQWAGSTNKLFRVNRSTVPSRDNYSTLTNGVRGLVPVNVFTDTNATNGSYFYWVEQE